MLLIAEYWILWFLAPLIFLKPQLDYFVFGFFCFPTIFVFLLFGQLPQIPYVRSSVSLQALRPGPPGQGLQARASRPGHPCQGPQDRSPKPGPPGQGLHAFFLSLTALLLLVIQSNSIFCLHLLYLIQCQLCMCAPILSA